MEYKVKGLSDYSEENLIGELQRVDKLLNKNTLSKREFTKYLRVSVQPLHSKFGSFNSALVKAGLNISRLRNITDEDLLQEIERVWNQLGRQPTHIEM
jgi:hypothetical protein